MVEPEEVSVHVSVLSVPAMKGEPPTLIVGVTPEGLEVLGKGWSVTTGRGTEGMPRIMILRIEQDAAKDERSFRRAVAMELQVKKMRRDVLGG